MDRNTRRTVLVPMDHGVTVGPIPGLIQIPPTANLIAEGGRNAAIVHRGAAMFGHRGYGKDLGLILHLSASTTLAPDSNRKVLVATVRTALQMGRTRYPIHVNLGAEDEAQMLRDFGTVSELLPAMGDAAPRHDLHAWAEDPERVRRQVRPPRRAGGGGNGRRHRQGPVHGSPRRSARSRRGAPPPW